MEKKSAPESTKKISKKLHHTDCGIYIHIPFCRRRCIYCDFYTEGVVRADWPRLVSGLLAEFASRRAEIRGAQRFSLYIGGGTPSLVPVAELQRLVDGVRSMVREECGDVDFVEATIEVNPDDVTAEKADAWQQMGIDRVSMGVQTMDNAELRMLGRRHTAEQAEEAFALLRPRFADISLDLIFGLPGTSMQQLDATVSRFIAMHSEHISAYSLMYEERTALTHLRDAGRVEEYPEEGSVDMFRRVSQRLAEAGYDRYEISNYALPGFESVHNSSYWQGVRYVGLGPSAHSYDGASLRRGNVASVGEYLRGVESDGVYWEEEHLSETDRREERIMTALRRREGVDLQRFAADFGEGEKEKLLRAAAAHLRHGSLELKGDSLRLTDEGVMISDDVISDLF